MVIVRKPACFARSCRRPAHARRGSRIGIALADSIDELLREEAITPQLAQTIMVQVCRLGGGGPGTALARLEADLVLQFDHAIINALKNKVKAKAKFTVRCSFPLSPSIAPGLGRFADRALSAAAHDTNARYPIPPDVSPPNRPRARPSTTSTRCTSST